MFFLHILIILAVIAVIDYQKRDIPQWSIALAWLIYGFSFALVSWNQYDYFLATFLPIMALGALWAYRVFIEYLHKQKLNPKLSKSMRFGLGDVFVLPLMFPLAAQTQLYFYAWLAIAAFMGWAWFVNMPKDSWQHKHGIPFITFSFIALLIVIMLAKGPVLNHW